MHLLIASAACASLGALVEAVLGGRRIVLQVTAKDDLSFRVIMAREYLKGHLDVVPLPKVVLINVILVVTSQDGT